MREDFEVQKKLLEQARSQARELEARVAELERRAEAVNRRATAALLALQGEP